MSSPGLVRELVIAGHGDLEKVKAMLVRSLLDNGHPDLAWKNFQGKTALAVALERNLDALVRLLREHGATA